MPITHYISAVCERNRVDSLNFAVGGF